MDYEASIEIDDSVVKEYVKDNFVPDEIFDDDELRSWALDNGFVEV